MPHNTFLAVFEFIRVTSTIIRKKLKTKAKIPNIRDLQSVNIPGQSSRSFILLAELRQSLFCKPCLVFYVFFCLSERQYEYDTKIHTSAKSILFRWDMGQVARNGCTHTKSKAIFLLC